MDAGTLNLTVDNAFSVADMGSAAFSISGLPSKDIVFITAPITGFGTTPGCFDRYRGQRPDGPAVVRAEKGRHEQDLAR